jgi:ribosomal-protein-alanine N-acetyltransferase
MSETHWQVAAMTTADLPAVYLIENQSPSPWSPKQLAEELAYPGALQLICRPAADGFLVGFLMARLMLGEAEILKIATTRKNHRQGVACLLLQSFIALAKRQGVCRFYLELRAQNTAALALYEKHAFEMTGRRPNYYTDPKDDALCMALSAP